MAGVRPIFTHISSKSTVLQIFIRMSAWRMYRRRRDVCLAPRRADEQKARRAHLPSAMAWRKQLSDKGRRRPPINTRPMGICNLRHIAEYIEKRRLCAERYRERLMGVDGMVLCPVQDNVRSNYAYFPVVFEKKRFGLNRDQVLNRLSQEKIFARKYFYPLTSEFAVVRKAFNVNETPIAKHIADNVLTLPLYSDLTVSDTDKICDIICGKA